MQKGYSFYFTVLAGLMVFASLVANVLSTLVAPYKFGVFQLSGGFIIFPIVFVVSDILSEVYGYKASRRIAIASMGFNLLMSLAFFGMYALLGPERAAGIEQLAKVSWIICIAGLTAGQVGDWVDDIVFQLVREAKGPFIVRVLLSSLFGQVTDSSIFVFGGLMLAFRLPLNIAILTLVSQVICKLLVEVILFPVTVQLRKIAYKFDPDVYEKPKSYSILG